MYNILKNNILCWCLLIFSTGCTIYGPLDDEVSNTQFAVHEEFSYQIIPDHQEACILEGIDGTVEFVGTRFNEILIWGERIVESESVSDANAHLDYLNVEVLTKQDQIFVKTQQPSNTHGRNYKVNYHVQVPEHMDISVEQVNGPVSVNAFQSNISCHVVNGNINLTAIEGNVLVGATNGNIYCDNQLPYKGYCEMHLVNGNMELRIPRNTHAELYATIMNGNIGVYNLPFQCISQDQHHIRGILGDGNGDISLSTINGIIAVRAN